ncbi:MAG TPA: 23S rRNA (uracil(1939)-C(5))-methyltransferase RlmD [Atribacteraceae bacterium]|nr:23S rRNA (uracil(1939)-C(5))-methyltransferase RlmD [Atribacteraceae bacterium]
MTGEKRSSGQPVGVLEGDVIGFVLPEAYGVIHWDSRIVFVDGVLPGETARVEVIKKKKNVFLGKVLELLRTSPHRIDPPCMHYRSGCGGCSMQEIAYSEQIRIKERYAWETMHRIGQVDWGAIAYDGFTPSPLSIEYRNKMEFSFGSSGKDLRLGLRPRGRWWEVVDLTTCLLMKPDLVGRILHVFREYGRRHSISGYDPVRKEGILRNVLVRYSAKKNAVLIGLFTTPFELPERRELVARVQSEIPEMIGLVHITSQSPADALVYDRTEVLWGEDWFTENIGHIDYRVSLANFFQVNAAANHLVYERAKSMANPTDGDWLFDLYCGGGGLGLYLADAVSRVVGVEENPNAIEDARNNALANNLANVSLITGKVEQELVDYPVKEIPIVTVDPPRCGLNRKVIRRLCRLVPEKIIYVSCNISSLARDTTLFREHGYHLRQIGFVDLFPQTVHFEAIGLFTR